MAEWLIKVCLDECDGYVGATVQDLNANSRGQLETFRIFCKRVVCDDVRISGLTMRRDGCERFCDALLLGTNIVKVTICRWDNPIPLETFLKYPNLKELSFEDGEGLIVSDDDRISENLKVFELFATKIYSTDAKTLTDTDWLTRVVSSPTCGLERLGMGDCGIDDFSSFTDALRTNERLKRLRLQDETKFLNFDEWINCLAENRVLEDFETFNLRVDDDGNLQSATRFLRSNFYVRKIIFVFRDALTTSKYFPEFEKEYLVNPVVRIRGRNENMDASTKLDFLNSLKFSERTRVLSTWTTFASTATNTIENGNELKFASSRGLLEMLGRCLSTEE